MTYTDNFRTAMRGFNRSDVVQFIQRLTADHEQTLRSLREENERLTRSLEAAQTDLEAAVAEKSVLEEQLLALGEQPEAENTAPAAPVSLDAPIAPAEETIANVDELELAAYRRAELAERLARERAAAADAQMRALFEQTREKLTFATGDFGTVLDAFQENFDRLRQVIQSAQGVLAESGESVKAVESILDEL